MNENLGFSKGCNIGVKTASGELILFLNPDCIVDKEAIPDLICELTNNLSVGMVGGLLLNSNGTEQEGGRRLIPTPWRSLMKMLRIPWLVSRYPKYFSDFSLHNKPLPNEPEMVEAISGACMLVKREAFDDVGGFDEGYFMHCEDLDWCVRFKAKGWRIVFVPTAKIYHEKGVCSRSRPIFVEWHKHKGMIRFYNIHFYKAYPRALLWFVFITVWLHFCLVALLHFKKSNGTK